MKFTFICEDEEEGTKNTLETPEFVQWNTGLYYFMQFLDGCGFVIDQGKVFELVDGERTDLLGNLTYE
jgi:hypothetical protein